MAVFSYALILATIAFAVADPELEQFAQKISDAVKSQLTEGSTLLSFANGEQLTFELLNDTKKETIKVKVTFEGKVNVVAERNDKKVNITNTHSGGATLKVNESHDEDNTLDAPFGRDTLDDFIDVLFREKTIEQENLSADEVGVLLKHSAKTDLKVKDGKKSGKADVKGAFVVSSKTKVTSDSL